MTDPQLLSKFIGTWKLETVFHESPIPDDIGATATFEWALGDAFLIQRAEIDHPDAPNSLAIIAPNSEGEGFTQHYFDTRGVVRIYQMSFDGRIWTLTRERADFSPLDFRQRYTGTFDEDGRAIRGTWEIGHPGEDWKTDFELNYLRID